MNRRSSADGRYAAALTCLTFLLLLLLSLLLGRHYAVSPWYNNVRRCRGARNILACGAAWFDGDMAPRQERQTRVLNHIAVRLRCAAGSRLPLAAPGMLSRPALAGVLSRSVRALFTFTALPSAAVHCLTDSVPPCDLRARKWRRCLPSLPAVCRRASLI